MTTDLARQLFEYDGQPLTVITYHDRPVCIAREFGALLNYDDGGKNLIRKLSDWSERLVDGKHLIHLTGAELAAFKSIMPLGDDSSPSRAPSLILLTEAGMNLVLILSRQPKAAAIQDWLAEEVMPQLTRDGRYDPSRRVEGPHVVEPVPTPPARDELADLRQRLDLARGLLAELPEDRRASATEALLRVVVPGLELPVPAPRPGPAMVALPERLSVADLLADVVAWARANRLRLWPATPATSAASWLGSWEEGDDLYLAPAALRAAVGYLPSRATLAAWAMSGALVRPDRGHFTARVRVKEVRVRCYRFAAAYLSRA
jgi:prophage antirepressor-like protein